MKTLLTALAFAAFALAASTASANEAATAGAPMKHSAKHHSHHHHARHGQHHVKHTADRPVQVGSHYPFAETNQALHFDRSLAVGMHLDIPAGTAIRFEPGERKTVSLVIAGGAPDATFERHWTGEEIEA